MKALTLPFFFVLALTSTGVRGDRITVFPLDERPEGITEGPGSTLFVGQILSGRVMAVDALTGKTTEVVGAQTNRQAWGLEYYKDAIFVAGGGPSFGGGTPEVYVYNSVTGDSLAKCAPVSLNEFGSFLNDVTVRNGVAYITDSVNGKLMAVDAVQAIAGNCSVWEVDLPVDFDPTVQDDFGANGVVSYAEGILVGHEIDGSVWYITKMEPNDNGTVSPSFQEVIPDGGAPGADGLMVLADKLYVTQNVDNVIGAYRLTLDGDAVVAERVGNLTSDMFDTPATSAAYDGYIYSTNSRFVALPDIGAAADDNVIGVKNTFSEEEPETESMSQARTASAHSLGVIVVLFLLSCQMIVY